MTGQVEVGEQERDLIASAGQGDARRSLNLLERAVQTAKAKGLSALDPATLEEVAQRRLVLYDKQGSAHYDFASAFIKSLRGSDPDAALYYLAVMLTAGEDPIFIAGGSSSSPRKTWATPTHGRWSWQWRLPGRLNSWGFPSAGSILLKP